MWFKKKENKKPVCIHKWKDFPPYLVYSTTNMLVQIIEPYVCVYCKERKDVYLLNECWKGEGIYSYSHFQQVVKQYQDTYKDILRPRVIVEDMVHDEMLVDREHLRILEDIRSGNGLRPVRRPDPLGHDEE
ncbi:MAG: hypothetical protein IJV14_10865 [Lachnospiraceae bacterium]|nr:hypothetical protein [Lachnospiraceae bacterium]